MIPGWKKRESSWRKQLLSYAKGNVLETGVETGINFRYYPIDVSVTATDMSRKLVAEAQKQAEKFGVTASMIVSPAEELHFLPQYFDTIVSTFSLSSCENPAGVLQHFRRWCKPEGRILLLEYGLSHHAWIRWLQQRIQPFHYRRTGQHINRDITRLVQEASLQIKKIEKKYGGSVYLIWAGVKKETIINNVDK